MVRWALDSGPGSVLDPSYGGCVFLEAAFQHLSAAVDTPAEMLFGADVDEETEEWSRRLVERGTPRENLLRRDFLSLRPGVDLPQVSAVVGNPPYVRHHLLSDEAVSTASSALEAAGLRLSGRASLWAYFVLHSASFVRPGGRMTFLLPGTLLNADYARGVLSYLRSSFDAIDLVRLGERIFPDADEETVVLLASGRGGSTTQHSVYEAATYEQFAELVSAMPPYASGSQKRATGENWKWGLLEEQCRALVTELLANARIKPLGHMANVSIGTVTGANAFFVVTEEELESLGLVPEDTSVPVIARSAHLRRPIVTSQELRNLSELGKRTRLLTLPKEFAIARNTQFARRVAAGERDGLPTRRHCQRSPWWSLASVPIPDAFLPYMGGNFKGISVNSADAASTNAVHQLNWLPSVESKVAAGAVLSSWSVLAALCAEIYGRQYGGGVLKLEVSAASYLPVLADCRLAEKDLQELRDSAQARVAGDQLLQSELGLSEDELERLNRNLLRLQMRRRIPRAAA